MGMGDAYTAIADDPFAAYYNPAGFAINPGVDIATSFTKEGFRVDVDDKEGRQGERSPHLHLLLQSLQRFLELAPRDRDGC
jgi:hypothetical protein